MLLWVRLHEDAAAQPGGARHSARGDPAEHELDPPAEHQVPPRHPALPLLALLPGLPGETDLPLPVALPVSAGRVRGEDAGLRLPLAAHAGLRQVPAGQRHVHHQPECQEQTGEEPEQEPG